MKNIICMIPILMMIATNTHAQTTFKVLADSSAGNAKMYKGLITKSDLTTEPTFNSWYVESQRVYQRPDTAALNAFKNHKDLYFIVFGGTWCEDTHYILPKFFKIQEDAGFPENHIALYATDRKYSTEGNISQALNVKNVPTIIVMKDGKELGRVVEYGKTGKWDKELAEILNQGK
ncbi:MAG: thioredoxin family protein [Ginsengibacter sp.]